MSILLRRKMSTNPHGVSIGDEIYYLKHDRNRGNGADKYFSGCGIISEIFIWSNNKILTESGTVAVEEVSAIMVRAVEDNGDTYKLFLKPGQYTYDYKNFVESIYGVVATPMDTD